MTSCDISGQDAPPQENGEVSPEAEFVPRKCDIITIAGHEEKCEMAKAALLVGAIILLFNYGYNAPYPLLSSITLILSLFPHSGAGAHNGGCGSVLRAASLHHWPEGQRDQEDDGGIRGEI